MALSCEDQLSLAEQLEQVSFICTLLREPAWRDSPEKKHLSRENQQSLGPGNRVEQLEQVSQYLVLQFFIVH